MLAKPDHSEFPGTLRVMQRTSRALTMKSMLAMGSKEYAQENEYEIRKASGDQVEVLKLMAQEFGATGAWTPVEDKPDDMYPSVPDHWECSDNGFTIIHTSLDIGRDVLFNGRIHGLDSMLLACLIRNGQDEDALRGYHEVVELKSAWEKDPSWTLDEAAGFGAHVQELRRHEERKRREWAEKAAYDKRQALLEKMAEIGTDDEDVAEYVIELEERIAQSKARAAERDGDPEAG